MKILFYYDRPVVGTTLLTWQLAQEIILCGHQVDYGKPRPEDVPKGYYDWVRTRGIDGWSALNLAKEIRAKIHIHEEGAPPYRVGLESAIEWGYPKEFSKDQIVQWREHYIGYMSAMYEADSCSLNGKLEFDITNALFPDKKLDNAHRMCYGVDARYALSLPNYPKDNYMITVSRLEYNKGVHKIAEALALLDTEKLPLWLIIGYGSKEQVDRLGSFCAKHKIKVKLWPCFEAQKWVLIKKARLMLQGYSGFPPAEGLLCNVPVLAFGHYFIRELFDDAILYAEYNNIEDFAHKTKNMLESNMQTEYGKRRLLNNELYCKTQEQAARQYDLIFRGETVDTKYDAK